MTIFTDKGKLRRQYLIRSGMICAAFYLAFALIDGPVWAKDSAGYAGMSVMREPLYPLFLSFFRTIFGEAPGRNGLPAYLFPAVIAQALVNAYAVWKLSKTVLDFYLPGEHMRPFFLAALAADFQLAVALLNRFVAGRASMYSETILTESLAMPLYLLFLMQLWKLYGGAAPMRKNQTVEVGQTVAGATGRSDRSRMRNFVGAAVYAFLLISLRKQMAVALLVWAAVAFMRDVLPAGRRNRHDRATGGGRETHSGSETGDNSGNDTEQKRRGRIRFAITMVTLLVVWQANTVFERIYNDIVHDYATTHTGGSEGQLCTLLYSASPSDAALFIYPDESIRLLPEQSRFSFGFRSDAPKADDTPKILITEDTNELRDLFAAILFVSDRMGILKQNLENGTARYYIDAAGQQAQDADAAFAEAMAQVTEEAEALQAQDGSQTEQPQNGMQAQTPQAGQMQNVVETQHPSNANVSLTELGAHFAASYDIIGYDVCHPVIYAYLEEKGLSGVRAEVAYDTVTDALCGVLRRQEKGDLLQVYAVNLFRGLVATNARITPALSVASMLLYAVYVGVLICLIRGKPGIANPGRSATLLFAQIVLTGILLNTAAVAAVIFPQPRYMLYHMGLFYAALLMMAAQTRIWYTLKSAVWKRREP